jgi:nucleotide-binding universal stress UspA family protein
MIGTIVVPLDGSELSERALIYAAGIANKAEAPLLLLYVADYGADEPAMAQGRDYLREIGNKLDGRVQFEVVRGRPAAEIVKIAKEVGDAMIVMSTHGRGGLPKLIAGSVADEVVRTSEDPVLLVRADKEIPDALQLRTLLVPVDGSAASNKAIEYALELAKVFGSTVHLIRVVDTPSVYALLSRNMETAVTGDVLEEIVATMTKEARDYLHVVSSKFEDEGISTKLVVLEGYPGETLVNYERRGLFDLVIMATAARRGLSRVVFGSVAERVLKLGKAPVIMIRPRETDLIIASSEKKASKISQN